MNKLFEHLAQAQRDPYRGRVFGVQLGIVTSTNDPLPLNRVQITTGDKGGLTDSDWCYMLTQKGNTHPQPIVGDTAIIAYLDGDAHHPVCLGIIHNTINPVIAPGEHTILDPDQTYSLNIDTTQIIADKASISLRVGAITLVIASTGVTINGQQIPVVGASVTGGRNVITRGY